MLDVQQWKSAMMTLWRRALVPLPDPRESSGDAPFIFLTSVAKPLMNKIHGTGMKVAAQGRAEKGLSHCFHRSLNIILFLLLNISSKGLLFPVSKVIALT